MGIESTRVLDRNGKPTNIRKRDGHVCSTQDFGLPNKGASASRKRSVAVSSPSSHQNKAFKKRARNRKGERA